MSWFKSKKAHIFLTMVLSLFALAVTSISTFAWFAVTTSGANPSHNVTAGSSDIAIGSVSSYRYHKAQLATGVESDTDGIVGKYTSDTTEATDNPHQDVHKDITFDTPSGGVGYYLIGNTIFSKEGTTTDNEYTYDQGYKMSSGSEGSATLYNVYLTSGMRFNIKRHYYATVSNEVISKNDIVSCSLTSITGASKANSTADVVYTGSAATYNVSLSGGTLTLTKLADGRKYARPHQDESQSEDHSKSDQKAMPKSKFGPTRKNLSGSDTIYYRGTENDWGTGDEYKFQPFDGDDYELWLKISIELNSEFKINDGNWDHAAYTNYNNKSSGTFSGGNGNNIKCGTKGVYWLFLDGSGNITIKSAVYVRGPAGPAGSWDTSDSNMIDSGVSPNYAEGHNVSLTVGQFKVATNNYGVINLGSVTAQYMPDGETTLASSGGLGANVFSQADGNISCSTAGKYDLYVYENNNEKKLNIIAHATKITIEKQSGSGGTGSVVAWEDSAMPSIIVPTRTGYTLTGIYDAASGGTKYYNADGTSAKNWDVFTTSQTLYAQWSINSTTITLSDGDGATGGSGSVVATYGSALSNVSVPTKTGYNFLGYYTKSNGLGTKYFNANGTSALSQPEINTIANGSAVTVYAYWGVQTTITFNAHEGSAIAGVTAINGSAMPTLSNPPTTRTGYTLTGIYDAASGGTKYYNADGTSAKNWDKNDATATLHAQWSANSYTVTFNVNGGGSVDPTSKDVTYDGTYGALPTPTWSGYAFDGWFTDASGGTKVTSSSPVAITANQTLYAHWTIDLTGATTYYVLDDQWTTGTLALYCVGTGGYSDFYYYTSITTKPDATHFSNLYSFQVPKYATGGFRIYKGSSLTAVNASQQTDLMTIGGDDSYGNARGSKTLLLIESENTSGTHKVKWAEKPTTYPANNGYYRALDFSSSATAMNNTYLEYNNMAVSLKTSVAAGSTFQIWKYVDGNLTHYDALADGANQATRVGGNIVVSAAGSYDIYLNSGGNIYVGAYQMFEIVIVPLEGEVRRYTMSMGDASAYNNWVYEKAVQVNAGDKFYIHGKAGGAADEYIGTEDLPISTHDGSEPPVELPTYKNGGTFLKSSGTTINGVDAYEFKMGGSYTFYWTASNKMTVAPVPTMGYGYYILSEPEKAYSGTVTKMKTITTRTSSQNKAFYYGFYATAGQKIAFRSYLDGVDHYFTHSNMILNGLASNYNDTTNKDSDHIISITEAGYYNIYVTGNDYVSLSKITNPSENAFTVGLIDPNDSAAVKEQHTSLLLEVSFTTTNLDASEILLEVNSSITGIGAAFYVQEGKKEDPYDFMRGKTLSTAKEINSDFKTTANNSSKVYYAYILIDYTSKDGVGAGSMRFSIKSRQYVPQNSSSAGRVPLWKEN